jgi:hypothetical protein
VGYWSITEEVEDPIATIQPQYKETIICICIFILRRKEQGIVLTSWLGFSHIGFPKVHLVFIVWMVWSIEP